MYYFLLLAYRLILKTFWCKNHSSADKALCDISSAKNGIHFESDCLYVCLSFLSVTIVKYSMNCILSFLTSEMKARKFSYHKDISLAHTEV